MAHPDDTGYDLIATSKKVTDLYIEYGTGLAIQLSDFPKELGGIEVYPDIQIRDRSSCSNRGMHLFNGIATIDIGYAGELICRFYYTDLDLVYNIGDKIAQLVIGITIKPTFRIVSELLPTDRNQNGFGSTDKGKL